MDQGPAKSSWLPETLAPLGTMWMERALCRSIALTEICRLAPKLFESGRCEDSYRLSCIIRYFWPLYYYNTVDRITRFIIRSRWCKKTNIFGNTVMPLGPITLLRVIQFEWNRCRSKGLCEGFPLAPLLLWRGPCIESYRYLNLTSQIDTKWKLNKWITKFFLSWPSKIFSIVS